MNRGTLILLILVIAGGLFYYFHDVRGAKLREEAEKQEKRLFPKLTRESLVGMELSLPSKQDSPKLVLEKIDGRWIRRGPPDEMVSVTEVGNMANGLVDVQRDVLVQEKAKPEQLDQFGLKNPAHQVVLKAGTDVYTLLVGSKTPDGGSYYVRVAPDGPVVTIPTTFAAALEKTPAQLRETSCMPIQPGRVKRIHLAARGQEIELALEVEDKKPDEAASDSEQEDELAALQGKWKILKPFEAPADGSKVSAFLWEWKSLVGGRFLQPNESVDWKNPELRLEVWAEGLKTPQSLEVGPPVAVQPTMRYVRRLDPEEGMVADFSKSELLKRDAEYFRDKHLLVFQVEDVEKVEGRIDKTDLKATRSGETWSVESPAEAVKDDAIRSSAMSNLLWDVAEEQWLSVAPSVTPTGISRPRGELTLYKAGGERIGKLVVGGATPDGKSCYVQVEGTKEVYQAQNELIQRWTNALKPMLPAPTASPSPQASGSPAASGTPAATASPSVQATPAGSPAAVSPSVPATGSPSPKSNPGAAASPSPQAAGSPSPTSGGPRGSRSTAPAAAATKRSAPAGSPAR